MLPSLGIVPATIADRFLPQPTKGIPKGEAAEMLAVDALVRFLLGPSGESEDHTEGSRRLFAYFLVGEKVGLRRKPPPDTAPQLFGAKISPLAALGRDDMGGRIATAGLWPSSQ